jgi:hypothetical protein
LEFSGVDDRELRHEIRIGVLGRNKQVTREEIVPSILGVNANGDAIVGIGADVAVYRIDVALGEVRLYFVPQIVEGCRADRRIRIAPIDVVLARGLFDEGLVFWRPARVRPRVDDKLAVVSEYAFVAA